MTERSSEELDRFREAVDRKSAEAGTDREQDEFSVRDKNTGKGKKTADKWNQ